MIIRRITTTTLLVLSMAGCAETHLVMDIAAQTNRTERKVWPAPPDEPRYSYVGELTGEDNFRPDNWANRSTGTKILEWLTGLADFGDAPAKLQRPQSGTVDAEGRIFVTDVNRGAVFVFDKPGGELGVWEMAGENERFVAPVGIVQGLSGQMLVADAELHSVFRLNTGGVPIGEFGRDILLRPTGLARDAQRGIVYVADTHAHDIKVFSDDGRLLKVIGRRGEGDGEFNFPTYLVFAAGKLYVTDTLNSRVQIFDADGNMVAKFGQRGLFVGNMVRPKGVAVDSAGNIYVVESLHDNLLVFDAQGRTLLAIGGNGKSPGEFFLPAGVWTDNQDQIYVADMFNGRITVLQFLGSPQ